MHVFSLNVRRVGGAHKQFALKRFFEVYKLDIVFLQETKCFGQKVVNFLSTILKDWNFCSLDVVGMFGGLVSGWNSKFDPISSSMLA
jgi:exonuclease III